jgi:adenosylcobinamide-GDP ribazoletransferase
VPDGLRLALTTFTVLPVRAPDRLDRRTAGTAMALGPLVGVPLAAVAAVLVEAVGGLLGAVLAVAALAALTRGLHLDGLVDTVDGLASYRPPAGALAVMRSPEAGPLGVAALVLVLLTQVAALAACDARGLGAEAVLLAVVTGRLAVTAACTPSTPAASPAGLGALVAGTVPRGVPTAIAGVVVAAAAWRAHADLADPVLPVTAVVAALLTATLLRRHAVRRLGGVTGDVLGALVETTSAVCLVVLAL